MSHPYSVPASTSDDVSAKKLTAYLKATYTNTNSSDPSIPPSIEAISSTTTFALSTPLSLPESDVTADKTIYLRTLRGAVSSLQDHINSELTVRMEKEAIEAAATGNGKGVGKGIAAAGVDEAAEEENYGEEVVQEDE
ncbi:uncharacterized protein F4812DRAFT_196329 [Daldinia caldariorum]|uniref:uncharacterized protein n=1 Tax=Daldinia caldariorum TaxID=326644 RepID=UPI0020089B2E|nr:uncharacterized protein F4812DRAFT_196329 [Daldinia caldariorum]KAI1471852.1 hypothetical protein F4812DRAFT_196329 [Daldinia caldariorum]